MKNLVRYLALQQISQNETFKSAFETETGGHFVPKRDFASGLVHDSHVVVQAFRRHPVLFSIGTAALLALAGTAALRTIPAGDFVAPVWPGTGLGVALAIICGLRIAPAIWIGAFISQIHFGESIPTSILLATMELSDALLPWLLLKSFAPDFGTDLRRIRDVAGLLIASPVIACGFTAFIGTALLNHPGGSWTQWYLPGVFQWWVGTASGSTIVAPLILVLSTRAFATPSRYTLMTRLSLAGMILAILGLNFFVFHGEFAESALYSVYPLALIAALVFGPRGTAATTLVCSLIAITATVFGLGPFIQANEPPEWTELQVFIDLFAVSGLLLSATKSERDDAVLGLRASHASLETKVSARTKQLVEEKASLELLQKVAAFASASLDSDTTLHDSLDVMRDFGGWDAAHVLLPASRDNSEVLCSSGIWSLRANGGDFSELLKEISQSSIAPNEGIPGRVVQTGDALQYCPVSSAPDCIRKQSLVRAGIHSTALLPITVGDRVRGILEFYRRMKCWSMMRK
jgi:integral membrane sensor domain MASE1